MLSMYHGDNVSFNSIMSDICMTKYVKDKTKSIKVIVSVLGNKKVVNSTDKLKCLRKTFDENNHFEYCGKTFVFFDDFESEDRYNNYNHYIYIYDGGEFRVDFKIIE